MMDLNHHYGSFKPPASTDWANPAMLERGTGFEPATFCLEGRRSTTELHPQFIKMELNRRPNLFVFLSGFATAHPSI